MNEIVVIGWAFAGIAAVGGVAFLVKMALRKPKRRTAQDLMHGKRRRR